MDAIMMTKPTITVYKAAPVATESLADMFFGMEEEGIPFTVIDAEDDDAAVLAHRASQSSALSVGLGCTAEAVVLGFKNLPPHQFVYRLRGYTGKREALRTLGANAARLAKGNPFKQDRRLEVSF